MDADHGNHGRFPRHLNDPMPNRFPLANERYGCSGWAYHGSHSLPHNFETVETSKLRSTVANLEFRLAAKQKEHNEAQNVINYLLRANANPASLDGAWEAMDVLRAVLCILRKASNAEAISHNTVQYDKPRTTLAIGDLLGLEDEQPLSQPLEAEEGGFPKYSSVSSAIGHGKNLKDTFRVEGVEDGSEQAEDLLTFDIDSFLQASDLTRSSHDQHQAAHSAAIPTNVQLESNMDYSIEGLNNLQYSMPESDSDLSGTTQLDVSKATTTSTISPSTSCQSSDEERGDSSSLEDKSHPNSNAHQEDGLLDAADIISSEYKGRLVTASAAAKKPTLFQFPQQSLEPDVAALFMPKWPVSPYTMNEEDRELAIANHQRFARDGKSLPGFFKFGIRFHPSSVMEDNFRTVIIDNLPPTLSISTLLSQVRGGAILDIKLLNTTTIHGHSSALITFVHEHAAKTFEERARTTPLHFNGVQARVVLLPTPTWPIPDNIHTGISQHGHTRCIQIHHPPASNITPLDIEHALQTCRSITPNRIERSRKKVHANNDTLELHFTSIKHAVTAHTILSQHTGCTVTFIPDPCAAEPDPVPQPHPSCSENHISGQRYTTTTPAQHQHNQPHPSSPRENDICKQQ
ncbi:MAG: hypothetical protein Q9182_005093 [Xanthomendoza sp. 2 TL-2023]